MNLLLASPRLDTVAGQDTELVFLEGLLEDDCKCEALEHGSLTCKSVATHAIRTCQYEQLACSARALYFQGCKDRSKGFCSGCFKLSSVCWTIRPI